MVAISSSLSHDEGVPGRLEAVIPINNVIICDIC